MRMKIKYSTGFILLISTLYFFDDSGVISALVPAVVVHELGHAVALRACGVRITGLDFHVAGLRMDYAGYLTPVSEFICAAAGPSAGIALALLMSWLGRSFYNEYLLCVSGVSLILSLYNLLPASPLDGGIMLSIALGAYPKLCDITLLVTTVCTSLALIACGIFTALRGFGAALVTAGVCLLALCFNDTCKNDRIDIK